jgi:hypothetical protein
LLLLLWAATCLTIHLHSLTLTCPLPLPLLPLLFIAVCPGHLLPVLCHCSITHNAVPIYFSILLIPSISRCIPICRTLLLLLLLLPSSPRLKRCPVCCKPTKRVLIQIPR